MSETGFLIPAAAPAGAAHRVQETIKRSRFITTVGHAPDAATAQAFIARIRGELPDATHHCWAYVAGSPGSTTSVGMSDDREPRGTAGRPMLNALLHSEVGEVVAVCTRYYGGVKLGTGGLARAYSGGVVLALESLPTERKVYRILVTVTVGYAYADVLRHRLTELDVIVEDEEFGADVRWRLAVAAPELMGLRGMVGDVTAGSGVWEEG